MPSMRPAAGPIGRHCTGPGAPPRRRISARRPKRITTRSTERPASSTTRSPTRPCRRRSSSRPSYDPWEPMNRRMHPFNNVVDRRHRQAAGEGLRQGRATPGAAGRGQFLQQPRPAGQRVEFAAAGQAEAGGAGAGPFRAQHHARRRRACSTRRPHAHLPNHSEDFGQTLGVWGWKRSRYVELPLFGPRTVRDVFGLIGDAPLSPMRQMQDDPDRIFLQGLQLVDMRTQLFAVDSMREGAAGRLRAGS